MAEEILRAAVLIWYLGRAFLCFGWLLAVATGRREPKGRGDVVWTTVNGVASLVLYFLVAELWEPGL